jgi:hypothetical protein
MDTMNTCYIKDTRPFAESVYYPGVSRTKRTKSFTYGWDRTKLDLVGVWIMVEYGGTGAPVEMVVTDSSHRVLGAGRIKPRYVSEPVFVRFSCSVRTDRLTVEFMQTRAEIRVAWVHALQQQHGMIRKTPIDHGATRDSLVRRLAARQVELKEIDGVGCIYEKA